MQAERKFSAVRTISGPWAGDVYRGEIEFDDGHRLEVEGAETEVSAALDVEQERYFKLLVNNAARRP